MLLGRCLNGLHLLLKRLPLLFQALAMRLAFGKLSINGLDAGKLLRELRVQHFDVRFPLVHCSLQTG